MLLRSYAGRLNVFLHFHQRSLQERDFLFITAQPVRQSRKSGVDAGEESGFVSLGVSSAGQDGILELVVAEAVARVHRPLRCSLRKLVPEALHGELDVGTLQIRVDLPGIDFDRVVFFALGGVIPA